MRIRNLILISRMDYNKLVSSGMFWELFPEATGNYEQDIKLAKQDSLQKENVTCQPLMNK